MTGFFMSVIGFSFTNESHVARRAIAPSQIDLLFLAWGVIDDSSESLSRVHQQVLEDRAQAECREKSERANDQNDGNQQACEQWRGHRERAGGLRDMFLPHQASGDRQHGNYHEKP